MKKRYLIFLPIILFAGFMNYLNTSDENERFNNPKIGHLYVFEDFLEEYDLKSKNVFKISSISNDSISFNIPTRSFPLAASIDQDIIDKVRNLDKKHEMFSDFVISISKKDILKYRENNSISNRLNNTKSIKITHAF